jgi:hypothetical protein
MNRNPGGERGGDCGNAYYSTNDDMQPFVGYFIHYRGPNADNKTNCTIGFVDGTLTPPCESLTCDVSTRAGCKCGSTICSADRFCCAATSDCSFNLGSDSNAQLTCKTACEVQKYSSTTTTTIGQLSNCTGNPCTAVINCKCGNQTVGNDKYYYCIPDAIVQSRPGIGQVFNNVTSCQSSLSNCSGTACASPVKYCKCGVVTVPGGTNYCSPETSVSGQSGPGKYFTTQTACTDSFPDCVTTASANCSSMTNTNCKCGGQICNVGASPQFCCPTGATAGCTPVSNDCKISCQKPFNCSDGTLQGKCSSNQPWFCDRNNKLIQNCTGCDCPVSKPFCLANQSCNVTGSECPYQCCRGLGNYPDKNCSNPLYTCNGNVCVAPGNCSDGTPVNSCSATAPKFCQANGSFTNNCTKCSCKIDSTCSADTKTCTLLPLCSPTTCGSKVTQTCRCGTARCIFSASSADYCCSANNSCNSIKSSCESSCGIIYTSSTTILKSSTTTTIGTCRDCHITQISVQSPITAGSGFIVTCWPYGTGTYNRVDCVRVYANGDSNICTYKEDTLGSAEIKFNCSGMSAAKYTAKCKTIIGTQSDCCESSMTQDYVIGGVSQSSSTMSTTTTGWSTTTVSGVIPNCYDYCTNSASASCKCGTKTCMVGEYCCASTSACSNQNTCRLSCGL